MALDGLGEVYEKRGGTGSAFVLPDRNPLEQLAQNTYNRNLQLENRAYNEQKHKEAIAKAEEDKYKPLDQTYWDIHTLEIGQDAAKLKDEYAKLYAEGVKPNDYTNPRSLEYQKGFANLNNKYLASNQQKKDYYDAVAQLENDFGSKEPKYDREASMAALNTNAKKPIGEVVPYKSLLVPKAKVFSTYDPVKDIKVSDFATNKEYAGPTGGEQKKVLNEAGLKTRVEGELLTGNEVNDAHKEHYDWGLSQGLWKNPKEYVKVQVDYLKPQLNPDKTTTVKEPKDNQFNLTTINNGNSNDLIAKIGAGTTPVSVPVWDFNKQEPLTDGKKIVTASVTMPNAMTLGNIKATVPMGAAINALTGEPFSGAGVFNVESGQIGTPMVYKGTNRVIPLTAKNGISYKVGNETKVARGTPAQIKAELIKAGIGEYKPMILASGVDPSKADPVGQAIWIPADAIIHPGGDPNKALGGGEAAYEILNKWSADNNKVAEETPKKTYTVKGKSYSEDAIKKAADASGMTVDEYVKAIGG